MAWKLSLTTPLHPILTACDVFSIDKAGDRHQ